MSRIAARFAKLRAENRAALATFITAGDPDAATSASILAGLADAGADVIELGMPFSDPMADGATIQAAGLRALKAGMTLKGVLAMVAAFRKRDSETPVVLMGYLNPIFSYGAERFARDAAASGVDGLIIVDVPPEEAQEIAPHAAAYGLDLIRLATPTSDAARLPRVVAGASGFIYYVAILGATGTRSVDAASVESAVAFLRRHTQLPLVVGFGIKTPENAAAIARIADGAAVGTALVQSIADSLTPDDKAGPQTVTRALDFVRALAAGMRSARVKVAVR